MITIALIFIFGTALIIGFGRLFIRFLLWLVVDARLFDIIVRGLIVLVAFAANPILGIIALLFFLLR